jgi:preprotein translocase subunit YajC
MNPTGAFLLLQAGGGGSGLGSYGFLFQIVAILAIFYFLIIRPQQKQRRLHEEAIRNLKKGDEIVTAGGIVGSVLHIKETLKDGTPQKSMDDHVTIKSGESRFVVERGKIAKIVSAPRPEPSASSTSSTS